MKILRRKTLFGCFLLSLLSVSLEWSVVADALPAPSMESSTELATAGYYSLRWNGQPDAAVSELSYEVQSSRDKNFSNHSTIYAGPLLGRVISGQSDGTHFYRVRTVLDNGHYSEWSNVVKVETRHHTLNRAIWFFAGGAVVFLLTLVVIIQGTLKTKKQR